MGADVAYAAHMLEQAEWAARSFADYDYPSVQRIIHAVAEVGSANAERYAEWAVEETEMGVAADKTVKNIACSTGLLEHYADADFVTPRIDNARRIVEIPRPAGVVLAVTPTTNPVSSVYFKILLALMTRNAVVVAPHPRAKKCCADAARLLGQAAEEAGAPVGVVQSVDEPSMPLMKALMTDERTDVIVATGGSGVVRAAYSSGNPALGVGPGNVPVMVDHTADINAAAERIVASKAFDNSVLCTNESMLVVEESVADRLLHAMTRVGGYLLTEEQTALVREYMFFGDHLNTEVVGKDASWIAERAGFRVTAKTKVLIAPVRTYLPDEPLTHEKLSPVLGMVRVPDVSRGIAAARSIVLTAGAGHSAAIHSQDAATIMDFTTRVPVLRVAVNVGSSMGNSGLGTNLAPSMTLGTGFVGRSSIGDNLQPRHLVDWARIAYSSDGGVQMPNFAGLSPWRSADGRTPPYPVASNTTAETSVADRAIAGVARAKSADRLPQASVDQVRDEIRRMVLEELSSLMKG